VNEQQQKIIAILADVSNTPAEAITPDKHLKNDLKLDSAQAMDLLAEVEDQLEIEIDEVAAAKLETVKDVLAFAEATG